MDERISFHERLKRARESRNWTQADLAEKLDCATKTVNRWENDQIPQARYRRQLCELFEMSAEELGLIQSDNQQRPSLSPSPSHSPPQIPDVSTLVSDPISPSVNGKTPVTPETYSPADDVVDKTISASHVQRNQVFHSASLREDWDEAPYLERLYGRDQELVDTGCWIEEERCRVVAVLGVGGVGKTVFATTLARQIASSFDNVFWRSLRDAPPLPRILQQAIHFLSHQQQGQLPKGVDGQIRLLMQCLQAQRCLFVLDNVESIFQSGKQTGTYREGYEDYGKLFQRIGEMPHQSCLILTSREKPKEVTRLQGNDTAVRVLRLPGVGEVAGRAMLAGKKLFGIDEHWRELIDLYAGNPLALQLIAVQIQDVFSGDIARFLEVEQSTLGDINDLLEQQFQRLSAQERTILYWLAIEREPVSLADIQEDMVRSLSKGELFETLHSLRRRSLIESREGGRFTLQPVIMEYIINYLLRRMQKEFREDTFGAWTGYALVKAQAKDYVRESQQRFILAPLSERLLLIEGREELRQQLMKMLSTQRHASPSMRNYLAGNIINLLIHMGYDLRGMDFSSLLICQAALQQAVLPEVNFSHAHFIDSTFSYAFGNVVSLAFSPDGNLLAAGSATGEIRIYQAQSNKLLLTCSGHNDAVWSLAFSPDGQQLASSSDDMSVRVWNTKTGYCQHLFKEHTNRVRAVAFSPDGCLLASGSDDQTIRIWHVESQQCLANLSDHSGRIWSLAFSPDGQVLASGSTDRTIRLWDVATWQCIKTIQGADNWIRSVRFHPAGSILASGSDDHLVRLWDVESGDCLKTLQGHGNRVWSVAFSPDGRLLASGSEDKMTRVWDVETGQCLQTLHAHTHGIRAVAFHGDGNTLASGGDDQCLRLWDVKTGRCLRTLQGYANRIWSVAFSGDGETLVSSGEDQSIRLWDVAARRCVKTLHEPEHGIRFVACSPNGRMLASCGEDQTVRLWDAESGRCLRILKGHANWVREVVFSPDGSLLASGDEDHLICLWEVSTGRSLRTLVGHTDWIRSLAFSSDGQLLASGSDDWTVRLWNIRTGECLKVLQGHTNRVRSVTYSPNGRLIASASEDRTIRLWNSEDGICVKELQGHTGWVLSVVFSPDGFLLASGSDDQTVRLWQVNTGQCLNILSRHDGRVRSVAFHPGGALLASGGYDGLILLWDVQTDTCTGTLIGERPYEGMNITSVQGLTEAQKEALRALGADEQM
ncbi:MAG TPA: NACHT domain-containing protein [Ktedonobacteraceae bacterium]|nr:NACHT domain-containing protein [Ktedonobacteraceae bacterium]